jgi:coproporphyrinogen III oxidase
MTIEQKKTLATEWFKSLRDQICQIFEDIDPTGKFERTPWTREGGGGGEISLMRGEVFEKVGVNISTVHGNFSDKFSKEIPGTENSSEFWASGISLVAHMRSPLVPAVHMNTRFICTEKSWFGGGADMTPIYNDEQDTKDFHAAFKEACDKFDPSYYAKFKKWADDYFFLPHRNEPRGIGGVFYDYIDSGNWEDDFNFTKEIGKTFAKIYPEIVRRNMNKKWTNEQREYQLYKRGRYVEFNLLFDRGTKFGVMTNGNVDAYMMSMPPEAKW